MPVLRLFAAAREAAGVARAEFDGTTVAELLAAAERSFGERFSAVLQQSRVWVNGEPATAETPVTGHDVVAVLPPVSGGAGDLDLAPGSSAPAGLPDRNPLPGRRRAELPDPLAKLMPVAQRRQGEPRGANPGLMGGIGGGAGPTGPPSGMPQRADPASTRPGHAARSRPDLPPSRPSALAPPTATAPPPATARTTATAPPTATVLRTPTQQPTSPDPTARTTGPPPPPGRPGPGRPRARGTRPEQPLEQRPRPERGPGPERPTAQRPRPDGPTQQRHPERGTRPERPTGHGRPGAGSRPSGLAATTTATATPAPPDQWWSPLARLGVIYDNTRPHGRIGLAWAVVTVAAVIGGPTWIAGWLGVNAFVAASQAAATRRTLDVHPPPWLAAIASIGPPAAAVFGGRYVVGVAAAGLTAALLVRTFLSHRAVAHDVSLALVIGMVTGLAAASLVVARQVDVEAAVYLLVCVCTYDAGAYLVGTGASAAWEGPLAGVVALIPVTILAAVVLVPPFPPGTPLALGLLAAVLAPIGPLVGTALIGRREADAPGLRRLDSLILLGPAWAWLIVTILH